MTTIIRENNATALSDVVAYNITPNHTMLLASRIHLEAIFLLLLGLSSGAHIRRRETVISARADGCGFQCFSTLRRECKLTWEIALSIRPLTDSGKSLPTVDSPGQTATESKPSSLDRRFEEDARGQRESENVAAEDASPPRGEYGSLTENESSSTEDESSSTEDESSSTEYEGLPSERARRLKGDEPRLGAYISRLREDEKLWTEHERGPMEDDRLWIEDEDDLQVPDDLRELERYRSLSLLWSPGLTNLHIARPDIGLEHTMTSPVERSDSRADLARKVRDWFADFDENRFRDTRVRKRIPSDMYLADEDEKGEKDVDLVYVFYEAMASPDPGAQKGNKAGYPLWDGDIIRRIHPLGWAMDILDEGWGRYDEQQSGSSYSIPYNVPEYFFDRIKSGLPGSERGNVSVIVEDYREPRGKITWRAGYFTLDHSDAI
ncbi:MAG: hypothetical protein M1837_002511 [Sclerophora amabilis]|nr:MAG: hypothetical protein M1837_002511 [Sclerophora amabilis]